MAKVIGIDLGTTNSCVSVMDGKSPKIILLSLSICNFKPELEAVYQQR